MTKQTLQTIERVFESSCIIFKVYDSSYTNMGDKVHAVLRNA